MARKAKTVLGAVAALGAGAAFLYLRDRNSETPDYDLIDLDGAFSLRLYDADLIAETIQPGPRDQALQRGADALSAYIFAKDRAGPRIAMTAPVTAEPIKDEPGGGTWRIAFFMPARWTRAALPAPAPGVTIAERPERRLAVVKFSGAATAALLAAKEAELRDWMDAGDLEPAGPAIHAFYNSPFIPGPLRHNEVMIPVAD